uniref:(northern house mosquito) hypothetical protein n=1 Tax=Culex pipiens TaxID=7175 RepID=A0A8D7ZZS1_CULPI
MVNLTCLPQIASNCSKYGQFTQSAPWPVMLCRNLLTLYVFCMFLNFMLAVGPSSVKPCSFILMATFLQSVDCASVEFENFWFSDRRIASMHFMALSVQSNTSAASVVPFPTPKVTNWF